MAVVLASNGVVSVLKLSSGVEGAPVALLKGDYSVIKVMGGLDGWAKRMKASTLRRIICRNAVLRELLHGRPIEVLRVISRLGVDVQVV